MKVLPCSISARSSGVRWETVLSVHLINTVVLLNTIFLTVLRVSLLWADKDASRSQVEPIGRRSPLSLAASCVWRTSYSLWVFSRASGLTAQSLIVWSLPKGRIKAKHRLLYHYHRLVKMQPHLCTCQSAFSPRIQDGTGLARGDKGDSSISEHKQCVEWGIKAQEGGQVTLVNVISQFDKANRSFIFY